MQSELRRLTGVDVLLSDERLRQLQEVYPRSLVVDLVRQRLDQDRLFITLGNPCPSIDEIIESVCSRAQALAQPSLRPVINASGVILHTNLGRAPVSDEAAGAMDLVSKGYCNLEFDLDSGPLLRLSNRLFA